MAVYAVQELQVVSEAATAEASVSLSGAQRIPIVGTARFSPASDRASDGSAQNRLAERRPGYLMPRSGGTLEFDVLFCGANVNTESGALSATHWLYVLLKDGLGGGNASSVGGALNGSPSTTSLPYASGTPVLGGIVRVGQLGDGRSEGHPVVVGAVGTPITALNALPTAPAADDKFRASYVTYPSETAGATKRFMLGFTATAAQWFAHGCQLESLSLNGQLGTVPILTLRYKVAYWQRSTVTIPSAVTLEDCKSAAMAAGSFVLQTVGTTTRSTEAVAQFSLTIDMPLAEIPSPNGVQALQTVTDYARVGFRVQLAMTIPWVTAGKETDYDSDGSDTTHKYALVCFSRGGGTTASEGRHCGFFLPRIYPVGQRPGFTEWNGLLYQTVVYDTREGTDTTSELTRSALRFYQS